MSEALEKTEQTEKKKRKGPPMPLIVFLLAILAGGGLWLWSYYYDVTHYFTTDNASVSANLARISPLMTGNVAAWNTREGDDVKAGQILGRLDLNSFVSSSDISVNALSGTADALVAKADIKTPITGKIVQSNVVAGMAVSPGTQLALVADTGSLFIKANVEETDIFKIQAGQQTFVTIDAYPKQTFTGYVESVGQATQSAFSTTPTLNTSGTYTKVTQLIPVKISLVNPENLPLLLGMNATVKISIKE